MANTPEPGTLPADAIALPRDAASLLADMERTLRTALCTDRIDVIKTDLRALYLRYQDFRENYPIDLPLPKPSRRTQMHLEEAERIGI